MAPRCYLGFVFVCHHVLFVPCSLVVTCWERADLLALLCVMFSCVFVTFPCGVLGWVCCLIATIPDLCLLLYFRKYSLQTSLLGGILAVCGLMIVPASNSNTFDSK